MAEQAQPVIKQHKELVGEVVSDKMDKTIIVQVERRVRHPRYKKVITKYKKFYAHDAESTAKPGDVVRIVECRPMSTLKRWTLGEVIRRAVQVSVEPNALDADSGVVQK